MHEGHVNIEDVKEEQFTSLGFTSGVSPFFLLFPQDVDKLYGSLGDGDKALMVALGYMDYCATKKYIVDENAKRSSSPKDDPNVNKVFLQFLKARKRREFADRAYTRLSGAKEEIIRNSIAKAINGQVERIERLVHPSKWRMMAYHFTITIIINILALLTPFVVLLMNEKGYSYNLCKLGVAIVSISGKGGNYSSVDCDKGESH